MITRSIIHDRKLHNYVIASPIIFVFNTFPTDRVICTTLHALIWHTDKITT